jgi:hypothetical protein
MSFWGWWGIIIKIFLSCFGTSNSIYAWPNATSLGVWGSTCSLHFVQFQTHSHYFIYIESLIIHRIFRTIMEPDGYFEAMKCKGAYGISSYPFWSSNYIIGPT